jgi:putative transposase
MFCQTKPCFSLELDPEIPPQKISSKRKKVAEYIVDETIIKAGSKHVWLWVAIEPENRRILALDISKERNMFVAERFVAGLVRTHGKHEASTDGDRTWYL